MLPLYTCPGWRNYGGRPVSGRVVQRCVRFGKFWGFSRAGQRESLALRGAGRHGAGAKVRTYYERVISVGYNELGADPFERGLDAGRAQPLRQALDEAVL